MRIFSSVFLTATLLGVTINEGWCPEPADLTDPSGNISYTAADVYTPPKPLPWERSPLNPENMTRAQRLQILAREKAAGRITNEQEQANFLATGNPYKSWTPPERKPLVKPAGMPDAQWQRILATRPQQQNYVKGDAGLYGSSMEQNAKQRGGTVTTTPGSPTISGPPPVKTTTPAPQPYSPGNVYEAALERQNQMDAEARKNRRYTPVTKLGVHPTQAQPAAGLSSSKAIDRLGSSQGATGGKKITMGTGGAAPAKAQSPAPGTSALDRMTGVSNSGAGNTGAKSSTRLGAGALKDAPRNYVLPSTQRSQDTFRQPK